MMRPGEIWSVRYILSVDDGEKYFWLVLSSDGPDDVVGVCLNPPASLPVTVSPMATDFSQLLWTCLS